MKEGENMNNVEDGKESPGGERGSEAAKGKPGFIWSIAALLCALIALLIPFLGLGGVALGSVGYWKGGGSLAAVSIGVSILGLIFGAIFMAFSY